MLLDVCCKNGIASKCLFLMFLSLMQESVSVVESRKFLPLLYQLAARMSKKALEGDPFQQVLQEVREWGWGEKRGRGWREDREGGRRESQIMMADASIHTMLHIALML